MPQNQKCFSFRGFRPLTLHQELDPWTPLGAPPQTLIIGSRYRARHGAVPPDIKG